MKGSATMTYLIAGGIGIVAWFSLIYLLRVDTPRKSSWGTRPARPKTTK